MPPQSPRCHTRSSSLRPGCARGEIAAIGSTWADTSRARLRLRRGARLRSPDGRRAPRLAAHGQGGSADGHVCGPGARAVQDRPRHRRLGCGVSVNSVDVGEDAARRRRGRARSSGVGAPVRPARDGGRLHALGRRHERCRRAADRLRPRLRQLAAVRRQAVPREGWPRRDRVRQPHRGARRHRPHADHVARRPARGRLASLGAQRRARHRARNDRADPAGRRHGAARSPSGRGHVALPARTARRSPARSSSRSRHGSSEWPRPAGRAALVARLRRGGCGRVRRARRHRDRRDRVGPAFRRPGHPAARARDHRHRVRPRSGDGRVRNRAARGRRLSLARCDTSCPASHARPRCCSACSSSR